MLIMWCLSLSVSLSVSCLFLSTLHFILLSNSARCFSSVFLFSQHFLTCIPAGGVPCDSSPNPSPWNGGGCLRFYPSPPGSGGGGGHSSRRNLRHSVTRGGLWRWGRAPSCHWPLAWSCVTWAAAKLTALMHALPCFPALPQGFLPTK